MSSGPISTADIVLCSVPYAAWVEWDPPSATCFPWSVALTVAQGLESTLSSQNVPTSPLSREASHETDVCRPSADAVSCPGQGPYPPSCRLEKGLFGLAQGLPPHTEKGNRGPFLGPCLLAGHHLLCALWGSESPPRAASPLAAAAQHRAWDVDCQKEGASGRSVWSSGCLHLTRE